MILADAAKELKAPCRRCKGPVVFVLSMQQTCPARHAHIDAGDCTLAGTLFAGCAAVYDMRDVQARNSAWRLDRR